MFITALQGADIDWAWSSATTICLLTFAGISAITFVIWERFVTLQWKATVPVMTWRFTSRKCIGMFMYESSPLRDYSVHTIADRC